MILEAFLFIAMIVMFVRIASADDQSPILWGGAALVVGIGCFFIPFPFARILIAAVLTFGAMTLYKMSKK